MLVRASPKSAQPRVLGLAERTDRRADLKIALKSAPEAGRANAELLEFLAKEWGLPKRALTPFAGVAKPAQDRAGCGRSAGVADATGILAEPV